VDCKLHHEMSDQARITVRRTTAYPDRLRAYEVKIDGLVVGSIRARESLTIPVTGGRHSLRLRIDWCGSEQINFETQAGEHAFFECGSSLSGWRVILVFFYITFWNHRYLWLRRAT
jgi:hypothetical protein